MFYLGIISKEPTNLSSVFSVSKQEGKNALEIDCPQTSATAIMKKGAWAKILWFVDLVSTSIKYT